MTATTRGRGISDDAAEAYTLGIRAFLDPNRIAPEGDTRGDYGEDRYRLLAVIDGCVFVLIYTGRGSAIHIISAGKANVKEVREYEYKRERRPVKTRPPTPRRFPIPVRLRSPPRSGRRSVGQAPVGRVAFGGVAGPDMVDKPLGEPTRLQQFTLRDRDEAVAEAVEPELAPSRQRWVMTAMCPDAPADDGNIQPSDDSVGSETG